MNMIDVMTGEIKYADKDHTLVSHAIGSCIVVSVYDQYRQRGAMAHIMLPGKAPYLRSKDKFKYAQNAIDEVIGKMAGDSQNKRHLQVCLAGGANVLKKKDDFICQNNINSVKNILRSKHIEIKAESLGGTDRRTMTLIVETGEILFSIGNSMELTLFDPHAK